MTSNGNVQYASEVEIVEPGNGRKPTYGTSGAADALLGWVLILKDLLRRVGTVLDEAEPMRLTLWHLQRSQRTDSRPHIPWKRYFYRSDQYIDQLRALQVGVRRELRVLELLLSEERSAGGPPTLAAPNVVALVDLIPSERLGVVRATPRAAALDVSESAWVAWFREFHRSLWDLPVADGVPVAPRGAPTDTWRAVLVDLEGTANAHILAALLPRVARYRIGASPEDQDVPINRIHHDLLLATSRFSGRLSRLLVTHDKISQALSHRSALLPPWFPRIPRVHRRGRYENDRAIFEVMRSTQRRIAEFVAAQFVDAVREVEFEIAYAYVMSSSINEPAPNGEPSESGIGPHRAAEERADRKPVAIIWMPFMYLDLPRYAVNMAHEIAHALFPKDGIERLVADDPADAQTEATEHGWKEVAADIRSAGGRLTALFDAQGDATSDAVDVATLVEEAVIDYVALRTIGPHYIFSLLAAVIHVVRLPHPHEKPREEYTLTNPITRLAALIEWESRYQRDADDAETVGWRSSRLEAARGLVDAYFTMFEQVDARSGSWSSDRRFAEIWRSEVQIYVDMFRGFDARTRRPKKWRQLLWSNLSDHHRDVLGRTTISPPPVALLLSSVGKRRRLEPCDYLHLVWDHTLRAFEANIQAFHAAVAAGDRAAAAAEALKKAFWNRDSEVRLLLSLRENEPYVWLGKSVVSQYAIDVLWDSDDGPRQRPVGWAAPEEIATVGPLPGADTKFAPTISWALGHYDVHILAQRYRGVEENLQISTPPYRGAIRLSVGGPAFFVRTEDYVVEEDKAEEPSPGSADRVRCFVRRWSADRPAAGRRRLLRSFGYVKWAEEYDVGTIAHLASICALDEVASLTLLYNGAADHDAFVEGLSALDAARAPLCTFAVRLKLNDATQNRSPEHTQMAERLGALLAELRTTDTGRLTLDWYRATDLDGIEVRVGLRGSKNTPAVDAFRIYAYVGGRIAATSNAHDVNTGLLLPGG